MVGQTYRFVRRSCTETGSGLVQLFIESADGTQIPIVLEVDEAKNMVAAVAEQISIAIPPDPLDMFRVARRQKDTTA